MASVSGCAGLALAHILGTQSFFAAPVSRDVATLALMLSARWERCAMRSQACGLACVHELLAFMVRLAERDCVWECSLLHSGEKALPMPALPVNARGKQRAAPPASHCHGSGSAARAARPGLTLP